MPDGKLRDYYWRIVTFLAERLDDLDTEHSAFHFPNDDEVEYAGVLRATLVFRDGSQLYVRAALDDRAEVHEYDTLISTTTAEGGAFFNTTTRLIIRALQLIRTICIAARSRSASPNASTPLMFRAWTLSPSSPKYWSACANLCEPPVKM